jgi:hypothetical protein
MFAFNRLNCKFNKMAIRQTCHKITKLFGTGKKTIAEQCRILPGY